MPHEDTELMAESQVHAWSARGHSMLVVFMRHNLMHAYGTMSAGKGGAAVFDSQVSKFSQVAKEASSKVRHQDRNHTFGGT